MTRAAALCLMLLLAGPPALAGPRCAPSGGRGCAHRLVPHGVHIGVAPGRRRHQPVKITRTNDSASPTLYQHLR